MLTVKLPGTAGDDRKGQSTAIVCHGSISSNCKHVSGSPGKKAAINRANELMIWAIQHSYRNAWQDADHLVERLATHHLRV
jgi:hypothetical protein